MAEIPGIPDVSAQVDQTHLPRLWDGDITTVLAQYPSLRVRAYGAGSLRFYDYSSQGHHFDLLKQGGSVDGLAVYDGVTDKWDDHVRRRQLITTHWKESGVRVTKGHPPARDVHAHKALEETVYMMTNPEPIEEGGRIMSSAGGGYRGDVYEILSKEYLGKKKLRR